MKGRATWDSVDPAHDREQHLLAASMVRRRAMVVVGVEVDRHSSSQCGNSVLMGEKVVYRWGKAVSQLETVVCLFGKGNSVCQLVLWGTLVLCESLCSFWMS